MTPQFPSPDAARPTLHVIDDEYDAIAELAMRLESSQPELARRLLAELARAEVHAADDMPTDVVTLGARIDFIDEGSGARRTIQLVLPPDADIAAGRVSILTPVGAGLIGLSAGGEILWPDRDGHDRTLRIISVTPAGRESAT